MRKSGLTPVALCQTAFLFTEPANNGLVVNFYLLSLQLLHRVHGNRLGGCIFHRGL